MYGWHSEQRIIHDLERPDIETRLMDIREQHEIKVIFACVHTRLAPCIAKHDLPNKPKGQSSSQTCDCYNCLRNWPERWSFKSKNSAIPVAMSVSYVDYPSQTRGERIRSI